MTEDADDFWEWSFEQSGKNPLAWQASAKDLLEAAEAVKAKVIGHGDGLMHSLVAVQAMLLGLALECLLKGVWIKKHQPWTGSDGLTKGGKYVGIPGAHDHRLEQLAAVASVKLSADEQQVLKRLSNFVLFAGRYPIGKWPDEMRPKATSGGKKVSPKYISPEEIAVAEKLATRLMRDVEPWK